MAIRTCDVKVDNIQDLDDNPNISGMSSNELKAKFDKTGADLKTYINDKLITDVNTELQTLETTINNDPRMTNSRTCNNTFDTWSTARSNLKITYGTSLPETADNGAIFLLYS